MTVVHQALREKLDACVQEAQEVTEVIHAQTDNLRESYAKYDELQEEIKDLIEALDAERDHMERVGT